MKLEITPYKPKTAVTIVKMANKNEMAIALESVKIRDYPEEIRNKNTASLVDWLLNLIGVNAKEGSSEQHLAAFKHVNETLGSYTYEEIKLAFEKYINGEYRNQDGTVMQVYSELNARVIGRVMSEYTTQKRRELGAYYREKERQRHEAAVKEYTEEEKLISHILSVQICFDEVAEKKAFPAGYSYVYDILYDWGVLPKHTSEYKKEVTAKAKKRVAAQDEERRLNSFEKIVRNAEQLGGVMKVACKEVVILEYFSQFETKKDLTNAIDKAIKNRG